MAATTPSTPVAPGMSIGTAALEELLSRGSDPSFFASPEAASDEDVHSFVERELVARVGDAGRRLHTGRSRNEQVSVDTRLYLRRRIPALQAGIEIPRPALPSSDAPRPPCACPGRRAFGHHR